MELLIYNRKKDCWKNFGIVFEPPVNFEFGEYDEKQAACLELVITQKQYLGIMRFLFFKQMPVTFKVLFSDGAGTKCCANQFTTVIRDEKLILRIYGISNLKYIKEV